MALLTEQFQLDSFHFFGTKKTNVKELLRNPGYRYMLCFRMCQAGGLRRLLFCVPRKHLSLRYGLEISPDVCCGGGLYLGHPYGITVNSGAVLGMNVNLHKGCTIGRENRGKRKGCPTIGSCVSIGINATVVGKISIGDDVMIAANAFVNSDIPSHSIVVGNPCRIIHREGATENYIINRVHGNPCECA